jgi:bacteriocin biosynthesis cyclodehydratase domain-containing protein
MRPLLAPAARRTWRDATTLQLGAPSPTAVVVEGLDEPRRRLLPLLDGSRTQEQVLVEGRRLGVPDPEEVLVVLHEAGLLVDADAVRATGLEPAEHDRLAPDLAGLALVRGAGAGAALLARRRARVVVLGAGRVGAPLAALLEAAGVGTVDIQDGGLARPEDQAVGGLQADDLGRRRDEALRARLRSQGADQPPAVVVLTDEAADAGSPALLGHGLPHLRARVEGPVGVVGPMVLPGASPCLHCLDLVRTALDPGWPALAAQPDTRPRSAQACDGVLAVAVAAQAALQVLQLLEGDTPASVGGTLELVLPGWQWRRRTWPRHPGCSCAGRVEPSQALAGTAA